MAVLLSLLLLLLGNGIVAAQGESGGNYDEFYDLPEGVTMCDGSRPVGRGAAFLLPRPLSYCMNYGKCRINSLDSPSQPCRCPVGFTGPHCEFVEGEEPDGCWIHCFSEGTCQLGAKSFEIVMNEYTDVADLQYCLCPEGKSGRYCEQDSIECGDFHCFNGSQCVTIEKPNGEKSHHCDCTTAYQNGDTDSAYAGKYCQHKATTFCSSSEHNGNQFCVNGGTCREGS